MYRTAPAPQQVSAQSDAVDARDLARRLEIYSIELQLRAQSRPGRSPSPPPRKKPPPDTPSTASSPDYSTAGTPGRQRPYSRGNQAWAEGTVKGAEAQRIQTKRASTIEVKPAKGTQARPQSLHPDYVNVRQGQVTDLAAKRQSRRLSGLQTEPVQDRMPTVPSPQANMTNWKTPTTTEEAAKALAALAQHERMLKEQRDLNVSRASPMTVSSTGLDSHGGFTAAQTSQANALSPGQAGAPSAIKAVHTHRPTLSNSNDDAPGVYTREASFHSGKSRDTRPTSQVEDSTKLPEKLVINTQTPPSKPASKSSSNQRKSTASTRSTELTVPSIPNSPLPSPGLPSSRSPGSAGSSPQQWKSPVFNETAFLATVRRPSNPEAVKEADRRSRVVSANMSAVDRRSSAASIRPPDEARAKYAGLDQPLPHKTAAEMKSTEDLRLAKQKAMRSKALKETGAAHLNKGPPKPTAGETNKKEANKDKSSGSKTPQRIASDRSTPSTPSILKKTGKSPANSRPPSRAATIASVKSRSRAASQVTSPLSISALEQVNSTPLPQTEFSAQTNPQAAPKRQKSAATLIEKSPTSLHSASPSQSKTFKFPDLAVDDPRAPTLSQPTGLSHSKSLSNFSRPSSRGVDKAAAPLTMPAPPDAVYRSTSRHQASNSGNSHSLQNVRSVNTLKGRKFDQTEGMTEASLALLQKMEAEMARREGASRADSRGHSRVGSKIHSRVVSRTSVIMGRQTPEGLSAVPPMTEKGMGFDDSAMSMKSKKKRGCFSCLG